MPIPLPRVPATLREMLKDYPEHVEQLQEALNGVMEKPPSAIPRFELAVWALEGRLETFNKEAREELRAAKASGDTALLARAEEKELLMSRVAWKHVWLGDRALREYFGAHMGYKDE